MTSSDARTSGPLFSIGTSSATKFGVNADGTVAINNGPTITSGTGDLTAAGVTATNGPPYTRSDGTGPNLYALQNGAWVAVQ